MSTAITRPIKLTKQPTYRRPCKTCGRRHRHWEYANCGTAARFWGKEERV